MEIWFRPVFRERIKPLPQSDDQVFLNPSCQIVGIKVRLEGINLINAYAPEIKKPAFEFNEVHYI